EGNVHALTARAADVVEVPGVGARCDELDIIAIGGVEYVRRPVEASVSQIAAQPNLERARHHLLEVRVAREVVRQPAGYGRVGTAELDHARGATRLVVGRVIGRRARGRDREANRRIESGEWVVA